MPNELWNLFLDLFLWNILTSQRANFMEKLHGKFVLSEEVLKQRKLHPRKRKEVSIHDFITYKHSLKD